MITEKKSMCDSMALIKMKLKIIDLDLNIDIQGTPYMVSDQKRGKKFIFF